MNLGSRDRQTGFRGDFDSPMDGLRECKPLFVNPTPFGTREPRFVVAKLLRGSDGLEPKIDPLVTRQSVVQFLISSK